MTLRNGKVRNKKFKRTFEVSIKTLAESGKEKLFSNYYSFLSKLKNVKASTILTI